MDSSQVGLLNALVPEIFALSDIVGMLEFQWSFFWGRFSRRDTNPIR